MRPQNANIVSACPNEAAVDGAANFGAATSSIEFIVTGQNHMIRQYGSEVGLKFRFGSKAQITGVYRQILRPHGTDYNRIALSENLVSKITAFGLNDITYNTPLPVQPGDRGGMYLTFNAGTLNVLISKNVTGHQIRYFLNQALTAWNNVDWEGTATKIADKVVVLESKMQAPHAIIEGDSLWNRPHSIPYMDPTIPATPESGEWRPGECVAFYLRGMSNMELVYQDMSVSGAGIQDVVTRYAANVTAKYPRYLFCNAGINNLLSGGTKANYLAQWTTLRDNTLNDGIILVAYLMGPVSYATNAQMQDRDDWNIGLRALMAGFSHVVLVDPNPNVAQFRIGGDAGNLWDLKQDCNCGDNIHYSRQGQYLYGKVGADALGWTQTDHSVLGGRAR